MSLLSRLAVQAARAYGVLSAVDKNKLSADYLVIAGGGSGGQQSNSGGGGAGGFRTSAGTTGGGGSAESAITLSTLNTYSIVVGAGGAAVSTANSNGNAGNNSSISGTGLTTITSTGGGYGGSPANVGGTGGSGGGSGYNYTSFGGSAVTPTQGNGGGRGAGSASPSFSAGGGGGAGGAGGNGTGAVGGGIGGAGLASSISGSSVTYAGGGGGSNDTSTTQAGGTGGGGAGASQTTINGVAGTANTGSGGGGAFTSGTSGAGGSGIVIISYTSATPKFVGGTITTSGGKQIHTFTSSGTLSPITPITASYLVVAGGAGGGFQIGGGGGAGGYKESSTTLYSGATYVVTVGAGGAGDTASGGSGSNGSNSELSGTGLTTITSTGGGGGASNSGGTAQTGGSGGGGRGSVNGAAGTSGQGFAGGNGSTDGSTYTNAGGGGGASAVGSNATSSTGGNGGTGTASSITGTSTTYAGGGGGGAQNGGSRTAGTATGGGGAGGLTGAGSSGTPNLGAGGGGGGENGGTGYAGGNGGSGIVIISYAGSQVFNGGLVTSSGGNTIHTFTSTGALTPLTNNLNNSLRFRSSASAYLSRTPTVAGNQQKFTWSGWVKIGYFTIGYLQAADGNSGNRMTSWYMRGLGSTGTLEFEHFDGTTTYNLTTSAVFRDPSAWYHITVAVDTTQATSANRTKIYVNGNQQTVTGTYVPQNTSLYVNGTTIQVIGSRKNVSAGYGNYFDGYMTDINFIDGQQLEPYYFGNNDANQVWKPIQYKGTYGTNGFYLNFADTSALTTSSNAGLGKDTSGNGNYWTTNNISITSGSTYDPMLDVPTNTSATVANYATWNPLERTAATYSEANLKVVSTSSAAPYNMTSTIQFPTTGKWYCEVEGIKGASNPAIGMGNNIPSDQFAMYRNTGVYLNGGISGIASSGTPATWTTGDIIGIAYDASAGTLSFYKNGSLQSGGFTSIPATGYFVAVRADSASGDGGYLNCGQRPFAYTPPTGYVALNTYNLPTPTILQGNKYMDATLYTGTNVSNTIVNQGQFKPDLVWIKSRSVTGANGLTDSVRGRAFPLFSNSTDAEGTSASDKDLISFNSNGFTVGIGNQYNSNGSGNTLVGWQWQAGQGSTSSNTSGSITSTVSVNTTAGFSIVTYTGTGANATVGHGLGVAPKMIIVKNRSNGGAGDGAWQVYHTSIGAANYLVLNTTAASAAGSTRWQSTTPTSSVFYIGATGSVNNSAENYVAYCWADVSGFSKAFSYTGNGSTDGVFVYLGFRPKFVLLKNSSAAGNDWYIHDSTRNTYNLVDLRLSPNLSDAEVQSSVTVLDFLSNGFKLRTSNGGWNGSGSTYIGMAWAENPFKNSNAR